MNNKFFKNFQMCNCRVKSKRIKSLQGKAIEYFSQLITFLILNMCIIKPAWPQATQLRVLL